MVPLWRSYIALYHSFPQWYRSSRVCALRVFRLIGGMVPEDPAASWVSNHRSIGTEVVDLVWDLSLFSQGTLAHFFERNPKISSLKSPESVEPRTLIELT